MEGEVKLEQAYDIVQEVPANVEAVPAKAEPEGVKVEVAAAKPEPVPLGMEISPLKIEHTSAFSLSSKTPENLLSLQKITLSNPHVGDTLRDKNEILMVKSHELKNMTIDLLTKIEYLKKKKGVMKKGNTKLKAIVEVVKKIYKANKNK